MSIADPVNVSAVLTKARDIYAARPDHTPFGKASFECPAVLLDVCGDDGSAAYALIAAAGLEYNTTIPCAERLAIIKWNAEATTEEVLATFDRAIEATR